jgi:hypothetical protein
MKIQTGGLETQVDFFSKHNVYITRTYTTYAACLRMKPSMLFYAYTTNYTLACRRFALHPVWLHVATDVSDVVLHYFIHGLFNDMSSRQYILSNDRMINELE